MLFHEPFDYMAATRYDQLFVDDGRRCISYAEAAEETRSLAASLLREGLRRGDRCALLSRNRAEMLLVYLACSRVGVVPVPLNYRLAPPEWRQILVDAGPSAIIAEAAYLGQLAALLPELPGLKLRIAIEWNEEWEDWRPYPSVAPADAGFDLAPPGADEPLYLMYTSGTTGLPKGVVVTHANYSANLAQVMVALARRPEAGSNALVVTPLYHAAAVWIAAFAIQCGMTIHLHRDFDPVAVVETLERERTAFTFLVPAMIQACLDGVPDIHQRDLSGLDLLMYGASPIAEALLRRTLAVLRCHVYQAYGLTETTAILSLLGDAEHRRAIAGEPSLLLSAGRALPGTRLRIESDEVLAQGPQIVSSYWRNPEATADFLHNGWAHTGDAGEIDAGGYLYIRDRIKDMIVTGGENVYSREVELVLLRHPEIIDAAVIGVPDRRYGEALLACVVPRTAERPDAKELESFCRAQLAGYKTPRIFAFRHHLPRNASGKILKLELRHEYAITSTVT